MKQLILFLSIITFVAVLTGFIRPRGGKEQQPKTATVHFTQEELTAVYQLIDDSPSPGPVRKPLLQKLLAAYNETWPQTPVKADTTVKNKKP